MFDRLLMVGKLFVALFVFVSTTALWFWTLSTWDAFPLWCSIVYTISALFLFDRMMVKQWGQR